jgi:hypothetical protein
LASFTEEPDPANYYFPDELEERIRQFVDYYNHERYHESLDNLVPTDVFYDRDQFILDKREKIKLRTLATRRQIYYKKYQQTQI